MADVTVIDAGGIIAAHRRWFIFLGLALVAAGVLAIIFPLAGGLADKKSNRFSGQPYKTHAASRGALARSMRSAWRGGPTG